MSLVPIEFKQRSWVALPNAQNTSTLHKRRSWRVRNLREALRGYRNEQIMAEEGHWVYIFGPNLDPDALAAGENELCSFHIDTASGTFRCARYRKGQIVRCVERIAWGEVISVGRPGHKREPPLEPFDAEAVLEFADAWHCDPRALIDKKPVVWLLKSHQTQAIPNPPAPSGVRSVETLSKRMPTRISSVRWDLVLLLLSVITALWLDHLVQVARDSAMGSQEPRIPVIVGIRAPSRSIPTQQCQSELSCARCEQCAKDGPCASLYGDCVANPSCSQLLGCLDDCKRQRIELPAVWSPEGELKIDFSCESICTNSLASAMPRYQAWRTCTACEVCDDRCSWMDMIPIESWLTGCVDR